MQKIIESRHMIEQEQLILMNWVSCVSDIIYLQWWVDFPWFLFISENLRFDLQPEPKLFNFPSNSDKDLISYDG